MFAIGYCFHNEKKCRFTKNVFHAMRPQGPNKDEAGRRLLVDFIIRLAATNLLIHRKMLP